MTKGSSCNLNHIVGQCFNCGKMEESESKERSLRKFVNVAWICLMQGPEEFQLNFFPLALFQEGDHTGERRESDVWFWDSGKCWEKAFLSLPHKLLSGSFAGCTQQELRIGFYASGYLQMRKKKVEIQISDIRKVEKLRTWIFKHRISNLRKIWQHLESGLSHFSAEFDLRHFREWEMIQIRQNSFHLTACYGCLALHAALPHSLYIIASTPNSPFSCHNK